MTVQPSSNFTDLFIRRPVLAIVVALLLLVAGVQATVSTRAWIQPAGARCDIGNCFGFRSKLTTFQLR